MGQPNVFTKSLATAASAVAVSALQSPGAGAILINGSAVTAGVAILDSPRRVIITSGSNDTGITFTVSGVNGSGFPISDTFAGANGAAAQSNLDFKTVTGITHTGSVAGTLTAGTNGVGSSHWNLTNWNAYPPNLSVSVELRSGAVNFTVEHTYDDPNILPGTGGLNASGLTYPLPWPDATLNAAAISGETQINTPITAWRVTINSGTGVIAVRALQDGISSP